MSTCFNYRKQHEIFHVMSKVAMDRMMHQEKALGGHYNDWYDYGKASCSYRINMLGEQSKCLKIPDKIELFNDYINVKVG